MWQAKTNFVAVATAKLMGRLSINSLSLIIACFDASKIWEICFCLKTIFEFKAFIGAVIQYNIPYRIETDYGGYTH